MNKKEKEILERKKIRAQLEDQIASKVDPNGYVMRRYEKYLIEKKKEKEELEAQEKERRRLFEENKIKKKAELDAAYEKAKLMRFQNLYEQSSSTSGTTGGATGGAGGGSIIHTVLKDSGPAGPTIDVDVLNYLSVIGISDSTTEVALDAFVTTLKTENIWDSTIACYPFVTNKTNPVDIQAQFKYNLKDPQDTDAAYRLTTVGSVTFNTTGIITGASGGRLNTHTSSAGVGYAQMWHAGSFNSLQGYWNSTNQIFHSGQYAIVGGNELGAHIYGRVDDNTMILCGPLAHRTGVSNAIYGGDYVVASIGGVATPGAYQFFGGYYLRTNSDNSWQVIDGDFIGRSGFTSAYSTNEISLYILTNPISKDQTLTLQTAINQLQTDLGRATH